MEEQKAQEQKPQEQPQQQQQEEEQGNEVNVCECGETRLLAASLRGCRHHPFLPTLKPDEITEVSIFGGTAIHSYVSKGMVEQVKKLIELGADFNIASIFGSCLYLAAIHGHLNCLKVLVEAGADVNDKSISNTTALIGSCYNGRVDCAKYLLDQGADLNAEDNRGNTCLSAACARESLELMQLLSERGFPFEKYKERSFKLLCCSCQSNNLDTIKFLVEKGLDPHGIDEETRGSLLHFACFTNAREVVDYLLTLGLDINLKDHHDNTPLFLAIDASHFDLAEHVIKTTNCNVKAKCHSGMTALMAASMRGGINLLPLLLERGANINAKSDNGTNAIFYALSNGTVAAQCARYLLEHGADRTLKTKETGKTSLFLVACTFTSVDLVRLLVEMGEATNGKDAVGDNGLHLACDGGDVSLVSYLIDECKLDVNSRNKKGDTPLLIASRKNRCNCVRLLLEKGADIAAINDNGDHALVIAVEGGFIETATVLLEHGVMDVVAVNSQLKNHLNQVLTQSEKTELKSLIENFQTNLYILK